MQQNQLPSSQIISLLPLQRACKNARLQKKKKWKKWIMKQKKKLSAYWLRQKLKQPVVAAVVEAVEVVSPSVVFLVEQAAEHKVVARRVVAEEDKQIIKGIGSLSHC